MFGFLKEKLKSAAQKFSQQIKETFTDQAVKEAVKEEIKEKEAEKPKEAKAEIKKEKKESFIESIKKRFVSEKKEETKEEKKAEQKKEEKKEEVRKEAKPAKEIAKEVQKKEIKKEEKKEKPEARIEKKPEVKVKEELKKEIKPEAKAEIKPEPEAKPEVKAEEPKEKKGFFAKITEKITKTTISDEKFNDMFWELELALLESNVAVEVIDKIKDDLKKNLVNVPIGRTGIDELIAGSLKKSIEELFITEDIDIVKLAKEKRPLIIAVMGVNGSGKTTTIAKLVRFFEKNGLSTVLAAADTFRTAAIEQLEEHANKLGVKIIKHDYGSDAAAVAFDAIKHAKAKGKDVVIIDTAGRTHVNQNLMDELKKLIRVAKPDLKIFVGDSLTGNDAVEQARSFNEAVGIDGIILTKVDVDEKGGSSVSISYVTKKPILYIGTGQGYDDLEKFSPSIILRNLQLESAA